MLYEYNESTQHSYAIYFMGTRTVLNPGAQSGVGASQLITGFLTLCSAVCCSAAAGSAIAGSAASSAAGSAAGPLTAVLLCFVLSSVAHHPEPQHSGNRAQRRALPARQPRVLGHTQPGEKHTLVHKFTQVYTQHTSCTFYFSPFLEIKLIIFSFSVSVSQLLHL